MNPIRSSLLACAAFGAASLATAQPAHAWWRGGVFIGVPPVVVGPPVVYPPPYYPYPYYPPAYYAPPPGYPAQPQPAQSAPAQTPAPQISQAQAPYGATCYAGVYVCPAPAQTQVGSGCSCPGLGAPSYGEVR